MYKIPQKTYGVTLIEVVIGFAIMSILTTVLYGLSISSIKTTKYSEIKQKASLLGQGIIEDFKSDDVIKSNTNSSLKLSNGLKLSGVDDNYSVSNYDLGNGYKANVSVKRNSSNISSVQSSNQNLSDYYCYTVNLKKTSLNTISISDNDLNTTSKDDVKWETVSLADTTLAVIIKVQVSETSSGKTIAVSLPSGNTFSKTFTYNTGNESVEKQKQILLSINCDNYIMPKDVQDQGFEVDVYNQGDVSVNISLLKVNSIHGSVEAMSGKVNYANNRSTSESASNGDLYDITVEVSSDTDKDKILYRSVISQNLKISK